MEYRIDRAALAAFVGRQVDLVEAAAVPKLLGDLGEDVDALWLGAGLATHVGLAIFDEPERFVVVAPPPLAPVAALAA
jgi:hypothetical protein